jgi:predicted alpha/beta hydrolase family esterase
MAAPAAAAAATSADDFSSTGLKVILAPGNGCDASSGDMESMMWYGHLARQCRAVGIQCQVPVFPDPMVAKETIWLPFMRKELQCDRDTIVVGHSSGACAVMRLVEAGDTPMAAAILVSAAHTDQGDENEAASGYFARDWQWQKIRAQHPELGLHQFQAVDDHLVPVAEARHVAKSCESQYYESKTGGHFQRAKFPELLALIVKLARQRQEQQEKEKTTETTATAE